MLKRMIGLLFFVAVIIVVILAVREKRDRPSGVKIEGSMEVNDSVVVIPGDSIMQSDTIPAAVSSEDLIMDMIGMDTIEVVE